MAIQPDETPWPAFAKSGVTARRIRIGRAAGRASARGSAAARCIGPALISPTLARTGAALLGTAWRIAHAAPTGPTGLFSAALVPLLTATHQRQRGAQP